MTMSQQEAARWRNVTYRHWRSDKPKTMNFSARAAQQWRDAGFSPEQAAEWRDCKFTLEAAREWRDAMFPSGRVARLWRKTYDNPEVAALWFATGKTPVAAHDWQCQWRDAGLPDTQPMFDFAAIAATRTGPGCVGHRDTPDDALARMNRGEHPVSKAIHWIHQGFSASECSEWYSQGGKLRSATYAAAWRNSGTTPAQAARLINAGHEPEVVDSEDADHVTTGVTA